MWPACPSPPPRLRGPQGVPRDPAGNQAAGLVVSPIVPQAPYHQRVDRGGPCHRHLRYGGRQCPRDAYDDRYAGEIIPNGAVLPVLGRTPDGSWLQVELPDRRTRLGRPRGGQRLQRRGHSPRDRRGRASRDRHTADQRRPRRGAGVATVSSLLGAMIRPQPDANAADLAGGQHAARPCLPPAARPTAPGSRSRWPTAPPAGSVQRPSPSTWTWLRCRSCRNRRREPAHERSSPASGRWRRRTDRRRGAVAAGQLRRAGRVPTAGADHPGGPERRGCTRPVRHLRPVPHRLVAPDPGLDAGRARPP